MNKRLFLAMGLSLAFLIFWNQLGIYLGIIEVKEPQPEEQTTEQLTVTEEGGPQPPPQSDTPLPEPQEEAAEVVEIERQTITLTNNELEVQLDNEGGLVRSAHLKNFYASNMHEQTIQLVSGTRHFPGEILWSDGSTTANLRFEVTQPAENQVVFSHRGRDFDIQKTFTLDEGFQLGFRAEVTRSDNRDRKFYLVVGQGLQPVLPGEKLKPSFLDFGAINPKIMQAAWSQDGEHESEFLKQSKTGQMEGLLEDPDWVEWAGVKDNYFANVFVPTEPRTNVFAKTADIFPVPNQKPNQVPVVALEHEASADGFFFMGPMKDSVLKEIDPKLENLITYGWAGMLSKGLFLALKQCYALTGNWGWAIIILTILIRGLLIPLTIPGIKSSYKMRELAPDIEKLKKKYSGNDLETKQQLSQATMALYKEKGVNPFSSCITMLPQLPVFFAYFSLLRSSIYLRQTDWIFWVNDLSVMDSTYILPILMGATMFFSTMAMPMVGADPAQQKMMKIMPVVFSLMFIGMPAGLILYMITSNLFTLGQTHFFKWRYSRQ